jgi:hypothetical protein
MDKPSGWTNFGTAVPELAGQEGLLVATYHYGNRTAHVYRLGLEPGRCDHAVTEYRNSNSEFVCIIKRNPNFVTSTPTREQVADELTIGAGSQEIVR